MLKNFNLRFAKLESEILKFSKIIKNKFEILLTIKEKKNQTNNFFKKKKKKQRTWKN